jgi:type IV pilus assembly protein PilW
MKRFPKYAMRSQVGFTLIELMVSIVLGLAVLVGLSSVYIAAKQSYRFQDTAGRLQEDAVYALDTIAKDLRMAGFAGCMGVAPISPTPASAPFDFPSLGLSSAIQSFSSSVLEGPNPLAAVESTDLNVTKQPLSTHNFIRGFDSFPEAMFSSASVPDYVTSADSLYFAGGGANVVSVTAAMTADNDNLTIGSDTYGWGADQYNFIVSDCTKSNLFAGSVATGGTQIDHSTAMGNSSDSFPGVSGNARYSTDAILMPVEWRFYYVATRSGASTPSLYVVAFDGSSRKDAKEVVANVESMKLHYGENTQGVDSSTSPASSCNLSGGSASCTPTLQADVWRTSASSVTDWSRVVAVRVGLMVVSAENSVTGDVALNTPTLLGATYSIPTGASTSRLRKEFSTTVVLRNRIAAR